MTSNEWALEERCYVLAAFQTTADATRTNSWSRIHSSFSVCLWKTNLQCMSWFMIFLFSFWISADVSFLYVCSFIPTSWNFILLEFATNFRLLIARLQNGRGFSVVLNGEFGLWSSLFLLFWTWRFELYLKLIRDNLVHFISQI